MLNFIKNYLLEKIDNYTFYTCSNNYDQMIEIDDKIECKTGIMNVKITFYKISDNYDDFFDTLNENENENIVELNVRGVFGGNIYDISKFVEKFRLPSNITKLRLPYLGKNIDNCLRQITDKLKLPTNIEKLCLQRLNDIESIDFSENTRLRSIKIMEDSELSTSEIIIPKNIVKLTNHGYVLCSVFKLPVHIQILKLYYLSHIISINFEENNELDKIIVEDDFCMPIEVIDLSCMYNLKIVKIKTQTKQTKFLEKLKLSYGTVVEFY